MHAMPTKAQPTSSAWNHEQALASLLVVATAQIVRRKANLTTLLEMDLYSWTAQCQEIPHLSPEPFYQVMHGIVRAGE